MQPEVSQKITAQRIKLKIEIEYIFNIRFQYSQINGHFLFLNLKFLEVENLFSNLLMITYWEITTIVENVLAHTSIFSIFTILSSVHFASAFVGRFI